MTPIHARASAGLGIIAFAAVLVWSVQPQPMAAVAPAAPLPDKDGVYLVTRITDRAEPGLLPMTLKDRPVWVDVGAAAKVTTARVDSEDEKNDRFYVTYKYQKTQQCGYSLLRVDGQWYLKGGDGEDGARCSVSDWITSEAPPGFVARVAAILGTIPTLWQTTGEDVVGTFSPTKPVFQLGESAELILRLRNPENAPPLTRSGLDVAWGMDTDCMGTRDGVSLSTGSMGGNRMIGFVPFRSGETVSIRVILREWFDTRVPGHYVVECSHHTTFWPAGKTILDDVRGGRHEYKGKVAFDIANTLVSGAVRLRGRVIAPTELVGAVRTVYLRNGPTTGSAQVQADGSFEFPVVLPGSYAIDALRFAAPTPVTISDRNPADVEVVVQGKEIRGRMTMEKAAPISPMRLIFSLFQRSEDPISLSVKPQSDGTFRATLPLGQVFFDGAEDLPNGYRVTALTYGSVDLLRNPTMVGASDRAELNIALDRFTAAPMSFVAIAPGEFIMGCPAAESQCQDWEKPEHPVRITKDFEIGKFEVTQAQWESVMSVSVQHPSNGEDLPVDRVSWDDAQEFLRRLNGLDDGYRYRLPTEAEWEYAYRAGRMGMATAPPLPMNWPDKDRGPQIRPVGKDSPNPWGLYDMAFNAIEWVQDFYRDYPKTPLQQVNPTGPQSGDSHVVRDGIRASARGRSGPKYRGENMGFRVVREKD